MLLTGCLTGPSGASQRRRRVAAAAMSRVPRMRHSAQYYDPDGPAITHDDAAWAISTAQSATEGTRRISEGEGLFRFEPS